MDSGFEDSIEEEPVEEDSIEIEICPIEEDSTASGPIEIIPYVSETRLGGWQLVLARRFVLACLIVIAVLYLAALPNFVKQFNPRCLSDLSSPSGATTGCMWQFDLMATAMSSMGLNPDILQVLSSALSVVALLIAYSVAVIVFWRRSDDWMALLVALTLALMPTWLGGIPAGSGAWQPTASNVLLFAGVLTFCLLTATFPRGRVEPRWLWLSVIGITCFGALVAVNASYSLDAMGWAVVTIGFTVGVASLVVGLMYRFRRTAHPVLRAQSKWAVFGIALCWLLELSFFAPFFWIPDLSQSDNPYNILWAFVGPLAALILAATFAIAVLRYRLYDIDVIINRTLVYGSLTAILAAVYFGVIYGAQTLVGHINHLAAGSPVIIVASTLLIAALFTPLRRRLQAVIDRRFYRRKYDAARTLSAFAATLRAETDLGALREHLLRAVHETMQPARASLWLAPDRLVSPRPDDGQVSRPPRS